MGQHEADGMIALIVNSRSRKGRNAYTALLSLFKLRNIHLDSSYLVDRPGECERLVIKLVKKGYTHIIVGGGDGTISSVVDILAHTSVVLGIIPLGTANSFARSVNIPLTLEGSVDVIAQGYTKKVDLGKINDDYFANSASIGLSPAVGRNINPLYKKMFGKIGYLIFGIGYFFFHKPFTCTITTKEGTTSLKALELYIANGRYHGGIEIAEEARVDSHHLHIRIIGGTTLFELIKGWFAIMMGKAQDYESVVDIPTAYAELVTNPIQWVSIDGEITTHTPIIISVAAEALTMFAPK